MPKAGRDLAYCPFSAELLVAASAPEVRLMVHAPLPSLLLLASRLCVLLHVRAPPRAGQLQLAAS